jgi:tetratricopeptide (TPR) repeat protein
MRNVAWCTALLAAAGLAGLPLAARAAPGPALPAGPAAPPPPADPYEAALAAARAEAGAGRFAEAAGALDGAVSEWPQDFPLALARAYYLLRAGRYPAAAAGYRAALALAPGSEEARRGLADAEAGRGAPSQGWLGLYGGATAWSGETSRKTLGAAALSLDAVLADRWTLGLLYRGLLAPGASGAGRGMGGGATTAPSLSHEGQAAVGVTAPDWSLTLHGAATSRSATTAAGATTVYGYQGAGAALAGRYRLGLDWRASAAVVGWEDGTSAQVEVTAALPLWRHLSLTGGWRGQRVAGVDGGAALAGLAWTGGGLALSLRGEYGTQRRPWDLEGRALYGVPEELRVAARLQATVPLGAGLAGFLGADLERWRTPVSGGAPLDATPTRLAAGLVLSF